MAPRFYCGEFSASGAVLTGDELHHLRAVRRLAPGDAVELFDGRGRLARCTVRCIARDRAELQVDGVTRSPAPHGGLTVAAAIPKAGRMDWLVEKVTELGAAAVWPLVTERSAVAAPRDEKQRRWHRRAIEACKQCGRLWLPEVAGAMTVAEAAARLRAEAPEVVLLAEPSAAAAPAGDMARAAGMGATVVGFVGPEGGFTEVERSALEAAGARRVRLAGHILRTETAATALTAVFAAHG